MNWNQGLHSSGGAQRGTSLAHLSAPVFATFSPTDTGGTFDGRGPNELISRTRNAESNPERERLFRSI
jgi:hypothetical protein